MNLIGVVVFGNEGPNERPSCACTTSFASQVPARALGPVETLFPGAQHADLRLACIQNVLSEYQYHNTSEYMKNELIEYSSWTRYGLEQRIKPNVSLKTFKSVSKMSNSKQRVSNMSNVRKPLVSIWRTLCNINQC